MTISEAQILADLEILNGVHPGGLSACRRRRKRS
jgi:hypothetical protein